MGELVEVTAATPTKVVVPATPTTSLAPGFRFHPTDEELVTYYLRRKVCRMPFRLEAVGETDVYKSEPWELAAFSSLKSRDLEWYFFSPTDRKYGNGSRLNRATGQGYWKATGKDRPVRHQSQIIGLKKTLVFHTGRAPEGKRTNWVMHEYRLADEGLARAGVPQDTFVLCRIFQKSGLGPPSGDRYAPFIDVEWDNGAVLLVPGGDAEDEMVNGDETRVGGNSLGQGPVHVLGRVIEGTQTLHLFSVAGACPVGEWESRDTQDTQYEQSPNFAVTCKRKRSEEAEEPELLSLSLSKKSKPDEPSSSHANGSEDSTKTSKDPPLAITMTNFSSALFEFPVLEPAEPKENQSANLFVSSDLEKSVPPGYMKFISNLEAEIINVSMERERLKIEMMRAQAMINVLQSRIEILNDENDDLKRFVCGG